MVEYNWDTLKWKFNSKSNMTTIALLTEKFEDENLLDRRKLREVYFNPENKESSLIALINWTSLKKWSSQLYGYFAACSKHWHVIVHSGFVVISIFILKKSCKIQRSLMWETRVCVDSIIMCWYHDTLSVFSDMVIRIIHEFVMRGYNKGTPGCQYKSFYIHQRIN